MLDASTIYKAFLSFSFTINLERKKKLLHLTFPLQSFLNQALTIINMNDLTPTPETQTSQQPEQNAEENPDPERLTEAEYASLRDWLETHLPPLKLSKKQSSLLSQSDQEPAPLKDCQAPLLDWLHQIDAGLRSPLDRCPKPMRKWLLSTMAAFDDDDEDDNNTPGEQLVHRSGEEPETRPTHWVKVLLQRLIRSLFLDISRRYQRQYGGPSPPRKPLKYVCNKCRQELWLREKDPWVCYWCRHKVLRKVKG